jgi:hypothetical protein
LHRFSRIACSQQDVEPDARRIVPLSASDVGSFGYATSAHITGSADQEVSDELPLN